jgi:hypothetical protein
MEPVIFAQLVSIPMEKLSASTVLLDALTAQHLQIQPTQLTPLTQQFVTLVPLITPTQAMESAPNAQTEQFLQEEQ